MPKQTPKGKRPLKSVSSNRNNEKDHWNVLLFVTVTLVVLLILTKWGLDMRLASFALVVMVVYRCSSNPAVKSMVIRLAPDLRKHMRE